ncbi:fatty acid cis/trans isomerase [Rheinheimera sp. SM2107]|uniref:Fatty acid cis/trans isomerase n=1 Tax=Arsukibacterium indicum TaxID=2848612 RepID=A0ABS6MJL5_9GAMM|nr:fatty acid cis/trans isomerase [Arsukibacterium indicum]
MKFSIIILLFGCLGFVALSSFKLDLNYGKASATNRAASSDATAAQAELYQELAKPIIERRCVVCHACYDAPCQLKMSSAEGISRGANPQTVYDGARVTAATPQRLFVDASGPAEWRKRGFHPVLNERRQTAEANIKGSLLAQMLLLKQQHPLPSAKRLDDSFDLSLNRAQQCTTIEKFDNYASKQPLAGMPYGLPGLAEDEHQTLINWLASGAAMPEAVNLPETALRAVAQLEQFLNADTMKMQLSARYIYEHLFASHLYFPALAEPGQQPQFYKLMRSATAPGQPVNVIASRRPFDDPKVNRVYYRLVPVVSSIVHKTHQPYAINDELLAKWQQWFVNADYQVTSLPGYQPEIAANPLTAFAQLPVNARYRFMLERAEHTIMGYIKGPVCRGQVALNVINDHFWVYFVDPDMLNSVQLEKFYQSQQANLRLPAEDESTTLPTHWLDFAKRQGNFLRARNQFLANAVDPQRYLTPATIWDGDGTNLNASLTVFRHFDNATVIKGLIGAPPKTAWVIDYVLLERIHYLLVAGFDVHGNFGHQLMTRLYMDFLRMEGESNFLAFLPPAQRRTELADWYQNSAPELSRFLDEDINPFNQPSGISFNTDNQKAELYQLFGQHLEQVQPAEHQLSNSKLADSSMQLLQQLAGLTGLPATTLPEVTMIMIEPVDGSAPELFTLIRNSAHFNVNSLFAEEDNRDPANDNMTLVHGLLGSYPDAFWHLQETDIGKLVAAAQQISNEQDYAGLLDEFGVRRTNPNFWTFSDNINALFQQRNPVSGGWLDYNRLENR